MESVANQISDLNILSLIRENNLRGWEQLYDKYAPVMYGVICIYTTDKSLADKIFIDLFIRLKDEEVLQKIHFTLSVFILRYIHTNTRKELKKWGINYTKPLIEANSIMHSLCSQSITIKRVAANFKMSENEVRKSLRKEFLVLRSQNQIAQPT